MLDEIINYIKSYGTITIAIYGVLQLWLVAIYKNFIRQPKVSNIRAGQLELGYSEWGPTLGIAGTLIVENKSEIIADMKVVITRTKDGSTHLFNWNAFRNPELIIVGERNTRIEMAYAFMLQEGTPRRYNVFFTDLSTQSNLLTSIDSQRAAWNEYRRSKHEYIKEEIKSGKSEESVFETLSDQFDNIDKTHMELWDVTKRNCYWEPGEYTATLEIISRRKKVVVKESFRFIIKESEFKSLEFNCINIQSNIRGLNPTFNFVNTAFIELK